MAYRTIIFDFDGTLADTLEESRRIYNELAEGMGLRQVSAEQLPGLRHFSLRELLSHLDIPKRRVPGLIARGTTLMRANIMQLPLIEGIGEVLPILRSRCDSFGILTSNAPTNVDLFLRAHGLREHFDFISSTSKLTGKAKHLRAIRKTFSLESDEMLYVGDEIRDLKASRKAGIPVAAVTWGFNSTEALAAENPTHLISQPEELLQLHS
ncbi:phosphoglycolate phosphatase-like HAD superfamily hydrolase [Haloferula luteola]|uniref:Phosphoglycolate phosphatase-like HAD superfamily hydrolase n=1 Tax=Haloferula luteola TaxID=595692 RepID=A0A840UY00_9BACT|nr:HAD hydrolase-like protein [Haloferula luteola]MBB5351027.1 phosphoglycolate phosphatase-like HAD superfamily hydrolase [Haloferula luteola]